MATRRRRGPVLLVIGFVTVFMGAVFAGYSLQTRLFSADLLLGGPLYGGLLFLVPVALAMLAIIFCIQRIASTTGLYRSWEVAPILLAPPWSRALYAIVLGFGVFWFFAVQAYWTAETGDAGITMHAPWLWRPVHLGWNDAITRHMACHRSKDGWHAEFSVTFRDGHSLDFASGAVSGHFRQKVPELIALTNGVSKSSAGPLDACPPALARVFSAAGT